MVASKLKEQVYLVDVSVRARIDGANQFIKCCRFAPNLFWSEHNRRDHSKVRARLMKTESNEFSKSFLSFFAIQIVVCLACSSLFFSSPIITIGILMIITFGLFATTVFAHSCRAVFDKYNRFLRLQSRSIIGTGFLVGGFLFVVGLIYGLVKGCP